MNTLVARFPAECPKCRQMAGHVRAAATVVHQPSMIRLTVRCATCAFEWKVEKTVEPAFATPASTTSARHPES
jgi:hypothetical protein